MMRTVTCFKAIAVLLMLLAVSAGCNGLTGIDNKKMPLLFEAGLVTGRLPTLPHGELNLDKMVRCWPYINRVSMSRKSVHLSTLTLFPT